MSEPFSPTGNHNSLRPQHVRLSRRCPVCGGRSYAEAKLPISLGIRAMELNLDEPAQLVESLSLHLLLALVELLPYKQFACTRCGHEFRLANQTTHNMVYSLLTSMEPVAATKPPSASLLSPTTATHAKPVRPVAQESEQAGPIRTAKTKPVAKPKTKQQPASKPGGPDWTPYHLDSEIDPEMDNLFDQFKEE